MIWSAARVTATSAKTSAIARPATAAAATPASGLPDEAAAAAAAKAPTSIMPSRPMLRTPARSTRSSPSAARRIGVASATAAARNASSTARRSGGGCRLGLARGGLAPPTRPLHDARERRRPRRGHREQRRALHRDRDHGRHAGRPLHRARARSERREEESRRDGARCPEVSEQRDRDRGVAVSGREAVEEPVRHPGELYGARETRERARQRERDREVAADRKPGETRRRRVQPGSAEPEPEGRERQEAARRRREPEGERDAGVEPVAGAVQEAREAGRLRDRGRLGVGAARLLQRARDRPRDQVERDEVEEDRRDDLAHVAPDAKRRRDDRPRAAGERARDQHAGELTGEGPDAGRDRRRGESAGEELSIRADVEDAASEREHHRGAAQE